MRAILAYLTAKPGMEAEFQKQMTAQAKRCLANEPGCLQFDVVQDPKAPTRFVMLEVYKDDDAIKAHQDSAALQGFPPRDRRADRRPQGGGAAHGVGREDEAVMPVVIWLPARMT